MNFWIMGIAMAMWGTFILDRSILKGILKREDPKSLRDNGIQS